MSVGGPIGGSTQMVMSTAQSDDKILRYSAVSLGWIENLLIVHYAPIKRTASASIGRSL